MKKFTIVIALIFSVMGVMGQKALYDLNTVKQMVDKSTVAPVDLDKDAVFPVTVKSPGDIVYTQDFATWPAEGWEIIGTNTGNLSWFNDPTRGNPMPCMSVAHSGAPLFRDEKLISSVITMPLDNPYLLFDFSTSHYWLYEQNSDDVKVYVSTDGGSTWGDPIWAEDDDALLTASLVPPGYANFTYYTARINMDDYAGQDVRIMFHFLSNVGGEQMGVSFYLDNFKVIENYTNEISAGMIGASNMNYGFYSALPKTQVGAASGLSYFHCPVSNVGSNAQTNIIMNVDVLKGETNLFNMASTPIASLAAFTNDTFNIGNVDPEIQTTPLYTYPAEIGTYRVNYTLTQNEDDQAPENNVAGFDFNVTSNRLARHNARTTTVGVTSFTGAAGGDFIGTTFVLLNDDVITGAEFFLSSAATVERSFKLQVYESTGEWALVTGAESDIIDITPDMPGTWITVNFPEPIALSANDGDNFYCIGLECYPETEDDNIAIAADNKFSYYYNYSSRLRLGGTWYYIDYIPAINAFFDRPTYNVTFNIADTDGNPVTNSVVTLGNTTNAAGVYTFEVVEGVYNYSVATPGYSTATGVITVVDSDISEPVVITGVENNIVENLSVYPNPVNSNLTVKFNLTDNNPVTLQLISTDGRVVYSENIANNGQIERALDLTNNANGVYFLKIESASGVSFHKVMKF